MSDPKDTETNVNDSETSASIDTGLTQDRSPFDLVEARKRLIAKRLEVGADTPKGHACSNLIEQLENLEGATGLQKRNLHKLIRRSLANLNRHQ